MPDVMDTDLLHARRFAAALDFVVQVGFGELEEPLLRLVVVDGSGVIPDKLHNLRRHDNRAAALGCLGRLNDVLTAELRKGLCDTYRLIDKVKISECQGEKFPLSHAGIEQQREDYRRGGLVGYGWQEGLEFVQRPEGHGLPLFLAHSSTQAGGILRELVILAGVIEDSRKLIVDRLQIRLRKAVLRGNQFGLPLAHVVNGDVTHALFSEIGQNPVVDDSLFGFKRGRL